MAGGWDDGSEDIEQCQVLRETSFAAQSLREKARPFLRNGIQESNVPSVHSLLNPARQSEVHPMREQAGRVHHAHGLSLQRDGVDADADGSPVGRERFEPEEDLLLGGQMRKGEN